MTSIYEHLKKQKLELLGGYSPTSPSDSESVSDELLSGLFSDSDSDETLDIHNKKGHKGGPPFECTECQYNTHSVHRFNAHLLTKKHQRNIGVLSKDPDVFECKVCNYSTTVKDRLRVHNLTQKHKQNLELQPDLDPDIAAILNPIKKKRIKVVVKRKYD